MSPAKPKMGIVISTTREGRFGDRPAQWLLDLARARGGAEFEIVDLRDYPLPFIDEPASPAFMPPKNEVAQRFGEKMPSSMATSSSRPSITMASLAS